METICLPVRRYAVFCDIFGRNHAIVVRGDDIERAPTWGGFVGWLGSVKPPTIRVVSEKNKGGKRT